jgi:hypothetical protein
MPAPLLETDTVASSKLHDDAADTIVAPERRSEETKLLRTLIFADIEHNERLELLVDGHRGHLGSLRFGSGELSAQLGGSCVSQGFVIRYQIHACTTTISIRFAISGLARDCRGTLNASIPAYVLSFDQLFSPQAVHNRTECKPPASTHVLGHDPRRNSFKELHIRMTACMASIRHVEAQSRRCSKPPWLPGQADASIRSGRAACSSNILKVYALP